MNQGDESVLALSFVLVIHAVIGFYGVKGKAIHVKEVPVLPSGICDPDM